MNLQYYLNTTAKGLIAATCALALVATSFFLLEPSLTQAQSANSTFTISQVIGSEISFLVPPANVSMQGTLNGLTGGTSNGSTSVSVRTNAAAGYTMTISFFNNSGATAMRGNVSNSQSIGNHPSLSNEPRFSFDTSSSSAVFGYTVDATNQADIEQSFRHNTTTVCNEVGGSTVNATNTCWMTPNTAAFTIINRTSPATAGATTTVLFRVHVPNSPVPGVVADTYTATATLTATAN